MNVFFINLGLKLLEIYTICKIYVVYLQKGYNTHIYPKIDKVISLFVSKTNIDYIKDNNIVYSCLVNKTSDNNFFGEFDNDFADFALYYNENNQVKISHTNHISRDDIELIPSKITFFTFTLIYDGVNYDLNIAKPFNYLIVDNCLDNKFFNWYMWKNYSKSIYDNYTIKYIDSNFTEKEITSEDKILIQKNKLSV